MKHAVVLPAILLGIVGGVVFAAVIGALLFVGAGRWDLPWFWAYVGVWTASDVIGPLVMDRGLIAERFRPGPGGRDYPRAIVFLPLWLGQFLLAGLDVGRFHWTDTVPPAVQLIGMLATTAALAVVLWASAVNRFFSAVIRIQTERGHRVITSGPYQFVRHPGYAASAFIFVGSGLALGSWLAALMGVLLFLGVLGRTAEEDRILREQLEGYAAYAERVRYRLLPGVW